MENTNVPASYTSSSDSYSDFHTCGGICRRPDTVHIYSSAIGVQRVVGHNRAHYSIERYRTLDSGVHDMASRTQKLTFGTLNQKFHRMGHLSKREKCRAGHRRGDEAAARHACVR